MGNKTSTQKAKKRGTVPSTAKTVWQNLLAHVDVDGIRQRFKRGVNSRKDVALILVSLMSIVYLATTILSWCYKLGNWEDKVELWRERATNCEAKYFAVHLNVFLGTCCIWLLHSLMISEEYSARERKHVIKTMQAEKERDVALAEKSSKEELVNLFKKQAREGAEEKQRMEKEWKKHENSNSYRLAQGMDGAVGVVGQGFTMLQSGWNYMTGRK